MELRVLELSNILQYYEEKDQEVLRESLSEMLREGSSIIQQNFEKFLDSGIVPHNNAKVINDIIFIFFIVHLYKKYALIPSINIDLKLDVYSEWKESSTLELITKYSNEGNLSFLIALFILCAEKDATEDFDCFTGEGGEAVTIDQVNKHIDSFIKNEMFKYFELTGVDLHFYKRVALEIFKNKNKEIVEMIGNSVNPLGLIEVTIARLFFATFLPDAKPNVGYELRDDLTLQLITHLPDILIKKYLFDKFDYKMLIAIWNVKGINPFSDKTIGRIVQQFR